MSGPANYDFIIFNYSNEDIDVIKRFFPDCEIRQESEDYIRVINPIGVRGDIKYLCRFYLGESNKLVILWGKEEYTITILCDDSKARAMLIIQLIFFAAGMALFDADFADFHDYLRPECRFNQFSYNDERNFKENALEQVVNTIALMEKCPEYFHIQVTYDTPSLFLFDNLLAQMEERLPDVEFPIGTLIDHETPNDRMLLSLLLPTGGAGISTDEYNGIMEHISERGYSWDEDSVN